MRCRLQETSMFGWGVLRRTESVWFCIGDLTMYRFLVPTHPEYSPCTVFEEYTGIYSPQYGYAFF